LLVETPFARLAEIDGSSAVTKLPMISGDD
jgi:hypothetical protein